MSKLTRQTLFFCYFIVFLICDGCFYSHFGATPKYLDTEKAQIDSLILFRPLVDPRINYFGKIFKSNFNVNGQTVENVGEENWKCLSNALVDYWHCKIESMEFSEDFRNQTVDL